MGKKNVKILPSFYSQNFNSFIFTLNPSQWKNIISPTLQTGSAVKIMRNNIYQDQSWHRPGKWHTWPECHIVAKDWFFKVLILFCLKTFGYAESSLFGWCDIIMMLTDHLIWRQLTDSLTDWQWLLPTMLLLDLLSQLKTEILFMIFIKCSVKPITAVLHLYSIKYDLDWIP